MHPANTQVHFQRLRDNDRVIRCMKRQNAKDGITLKFFWPVLQARPIDQFKSIGDGVANTRRVKKTRGKS